MMFGLWFSLKVHGLQIGAPVLVGSSNFSLFVFCSLVGLRRPNTVPDPDER